MTSGPATCNPEVIHSRRRFVNVAVYRQYLRLAVNERIGRIQQAENVSSFSELSIADHRFLTDKTRRAVQGAIVTRGLFHRSAGQRWIVDE